MGEPATGGSPGAIWLHVGFCVVLLAVSLVLTLSNRRARRRLAVEKLPLPDRQLLALQLARRQRANLLIGVVAIALLVGGWLKPSVFVLVYWIMVVLLVSWLCAAALMDVWTTRRYFQAVRDRHLVERHKLEAELRAELARRKTGSGNGRPQRGEA